MHNREVLAKKILLELGHHIGGDGVISEEEEARLKNSLVYTNMYVKFGN